MTQDRDFTTGVNVTPVAVATKPLLKACNLTAGGLDTTSRAATVRVAMARRVPVRTTATGMAITMRAPIARARVGTVRTMTAMARVNAATVRAATATVRVEARARMN